MGKYSHTNITPIETLGDCWLKREDYAYYTGSPDDPSGSKVRQYLEMASEQPGVPMVVGCASYSAMQIYVAWAAKEAGVEAHIFVPQRKERTQATHYAESMGAIVHEVFPGYANVYRKRARDFAKSIGGAVRWDSKRAIHDTVLQCMNLPADCKRILVPTGSGLTAAGVLTGLTLLKRTDVEVIAVCVSDLADEDNIYHNCDFMIQHMTRQFSDPFLMPRKPVLRMIRAQGGYGDWVFKSVPYGRPLDPFYSAKALDYMIPGDVLWVSGMRPHSSCPKEWRDSLLHYEKDLMSFSASPY